VFIYILSSKSKVSPKNNFDLIGLPVSEYLSALSKPGGNTGLIIINPEQLLKMEGGYY